ncbi:uncharacterized protein LOC132256761 [Phlebotomus argentipes]|uniref:uncharacterized protein LOC132256761 n=1 Tax=Phlebotomus argentipes TaxID=94469 RepID=UPI002892A5A8|nr:uncharacterized protein LOC132256761 [Phlebotomus argentipes]
MMMKFKFPKKLFCFELKIGAIITGWFHLLLSLLGGILVLIILFNHELYMHAMDYFITVVDNGTELVVFQDLSQRNILELEMKIVFGIYLFICIVNFVAAAFLIYGAMKDNHLLLVPWLSSEVLGMFIMLCAIFVRCPILIIVIFVRVYIWYCIWTFYRDMRRGKQMTGFPIEPPIAFATGEAPAGKPPSYGDVVTFK